ncbi:MULTISPECIES: T9SS type A sorting domain-containing protein [unclassified Flavobacterium]|uniref:T9SS type A sorting domain-containing protein n=1 Tax=unclassified Flavobacterium TaxID=196869 RepID=UPI0012AAB336|nr:MULTISPECIES: T9SS type A sorting domain-containing protein [unclassified Flavobacterium]MBF4486839.1 T9SS type A sorting domain-containing protein [Flavobacterium sp. CSZ]QGK76379.1 T9SS type A sorting domain-containing protein [Flavobacterium sp. SLB02]
MNKKIVFALLFLPLFLSAQEKGSDASDNVSRYFYDDYVVSVEIWYGKDKKPDSTKTYYSNGKLNEIFFYDDKGLKDSNAYQYNKQGEKLVTWNFSHGKLVSRTDHKLPFNKDKEETVKKALKLMTEINTRTNYNPTKVNDLFNRGVLSISLGNTTLALEDLKKVEYSIDKDPKNKDIVLSDSLEKSKAVFRSKLYDRLANIYASLEMDNFAFNYCYKAINNAPDDLRILYNFAILLQRRKSYDLARFYLEKIVAKKPDHAHAQWALAILYSDIGEYQKAMESITIAFKNEKTIIDKSIGYGGRDLRATRGLIYHKLGESDKGIADLKYVLDMDKNNSYAMKNLGIIYLDQLKYKEACELFRKADELNYTLVYDEVDLPSLLESACNNVQPEVTTLKKPYVFPNPAQTTISVENVKSKNFDFEFFDFESKSALKGKTSDGTINVIALTPGFYILKVTVEDVVKTFKVIKE